MGTDERGAGRIMLFPHDTEVALARAVALVNTGRGGAEGLASVPALERFLRAGEWTAAGPCAGPDLDAVRGLRQRLTALWEMTTDEAAALVNALLREAGAFPQLVRHDGWDYHVHAAPSSATIAGRMAADIAMAFADVIRAGQLGRLQTCAAADCGDVLVDLSKNRSRRFCGTACANRVNVAAYRTRRAAGTA